MCMDMNAFIALCCNKGKTVMMTLLLHYYHNMFSRHKRLFTSFAAP